MISSFIGNLPRHRYVWIDTKFIYTEPIPARVPAVWFGLTSYPSRAWGCNVMLESGAIYHNIPPWAVWFCECNAISSLWYPRYSQLWDCYGTDFSVVEFDYLKELTCHVQCMHESFRGTYLFTVAPVGDGFSSYPEQAKEFIFIELDNGRLTIQPTNKVLFEDKSFTVNNSSVPVWPTNLKCQTEIHSVE